MSTKEYTATSILLISPKTGKVLGATRRGTIDQWGIIGGKRDQGESIEACAMREFFEEVGVELTARPRFIFERECEAGDDGKSFYVATYHVVNAFDVLNVQNLFETPREVEPGILVGFVNYLEILKGPFGNFNQALLNAILSNYARDQLQ